MSVLMIAMLAVTDMDAFRRDYAAPLQPINARHGATPVAIGPAHVAEGEVGAFVAVLRFPDRAAFDAWYADADYVPLIERRRALTDPARSSVMVLTETS